MSLTSFAPSPTPYIHLPYQSNMYQYIPQLHINQDPQVPSRPLSAVIQPVPRIQHPQPYQPYVTAHLAAIGKDAVIAGQFDLCTGSVPLVPGNPALNALHPGVAHPQLMHPAGVAQQPPAHPGYMQYAHLVQNVIVPDQNPFYQYPNQFAPSALPLHPAYNYAPYTNLLASEAKVKLFSSILSTFTSMINNDAAFRNCQNWARWHDTVQALADGGVIGHICNEPPPGVERTEYNTPARKIWDRDDAWASSVLTTRLHDDACGFLGPVIGPNGHRRTAHKMYDSLQLGCQAVPDYTNCLCIQDEVLSTGIVNGNIGKFIQIWSSGLSQLRGYNYAIPWPTFLTHFIQYFPNGNQYAFAACQCQDLLDTPGVIPSCKMFDAFALKLVQDETLTKASNVPHPNDQNRQQPQGNRNTHCGYRVNGGANGQGNGGMTGGGHDSNTLDSKQGNSSNNITTMTTTTNNHCTNASSPRSTAMASITEQNTVPDVSLVTNSAPLGASNDIIRQSYPAQTFESFSALSSDLHPETLRSIELVNPAVFASIMDRTPMLLNSACTNHIVKDRHYFFTYDASGATNMTTANAGKLST
ncbi:hypothetical protein BT96DRAFT_1004704 [Gymnopus androsaceus JB14]|uniref:Uncharacterized protein n=1 Tax=Gymnopus androsaceus JB14 TaxID=1447944 RepID=A0A6A4GRR0_9AGAR|nr:hypothetical protein BT96DRAFT_1004704 [Gymnopus androsaceus JB14]